MFRSISARCGPIRGSSQISVASTFSTRPRSPPEGHRQQVERVGVAPLLLVGREQRPEIAEAGCAEDRVDHRMGEDVGVGVAGRARARGGSRRPPRTSRRPASNRCASYPMPTRTLILDPRATHPNGSSVRRRRSNVAISSTPQPRIVVDRLLVGMADVVRAHGRRTRARRTPRRRRTWPRRPKPGRAPRPAFEAPRSRPRRRLRPHRSPRRPARSKSADRARAPGGHGPKPSPGRDGRGRRRVRCGRPPPALRSTVATPRRGRQSAPRRPSPRDRRPDRPTKWTEPST